MFHFMMKWKYSTEHRRVLYVDVDVMNSFQISVGLFSFRNQGQIHRKSESILSFQFRFCRHIQIYHVNYVPECSVFSTFESNESPNMWNDEEKCKFSFHSKSNHGSRISTLIDSWREIRYIGCESVCVGCWSLLRSEYRIFFIHFFSSGIILYRSGNFSIQILYFTVKCVQNPDTEPSTENQNISQCL